MHPDERPHRFRSGDIELDGRLYVPEAGAALGCVVCHPHPEYGGDMNNNVVVGLTSALAAVGVATLRFNFRGVGASGGSHGGGGPEIDDARAAVRELRTAIPGIPRIAVVGYSFGAVVALRAAAEDTDDSDDAADGPLSVVDAVAAIAPPLAMMDVPFVSDLGTPLLFVAGDRDSYCPRAAFDALQGHTPGATSRAWIEGADHFFGGYERDLGNLVRDWVKAL